MSPILLLFLSAPAQTPQEIEAGRQLYLQRCWFCHGREGRGDGPSATAMDPRPRDFVQADYKIRSTPHGRLPTDEDLLRTITDGMPGTPMSGWKFLPDDDRRRLVYYLKSLSPRFASEPREPVPVPSGTASAERGRKLFEEARCWECHGREGRGDGPLTAALRYEWGYPYAARNLTQGWTFKGGATPRDIYLRITTGLNGTPMGPYADLLADAERWDLAHYVSSIARKEGEDGEVAIRAAYMPDGLPTTPEDAAWERARETRVPLAGQISVAPPSLWWTPTAGEIRVRALWDDATLALRLEWDDPTQTTEGPLRDSALVQLPEAGEETSTRPYFVLGDPNHPVRLWEWFAGESSVREFTAGGIGTRTPRAAAVTEAAAWENGTWKVVLRRALSTGRENDARFTPGEFVPILFGVRDGANGEREEVRATSTWYFLALEPPRSAAAYLIALAHVLGAVILEILVVRRLRRAKEAS